MSEHVNKGLRHVIQTTPESRLASAIAEIDQGGKA